MIIPSFISLSQGSKLLVSDLNFFFLSHFEFFGISFLTYSEMNSVAAVQSQSKSNIKIKKPKRNQLKLSLSRHVSCFRLKYELSFLILCSFNMQSHRHDRHTHMHYGVSDVWFAEPYLCNINSQDVLLCFPEYEARNSQKKEGSAPIPFYHLQ